MANTTQYAQALQQMANTITSQKPVVTDPLRQPTTFQQMMAANDPYIANGLGFAEMLTNPFIANKQRANMELQQSMQNKLKADELKAKAAADLDEHERYLREEARKDQQMKLNMLQYQEPVPGENFDTVAHEMLRAYDPAAAALMDKWGKARVVDRSNPEIYAKYLQEREADLAQLQRRMEQFKAKGLRNLRTKDYEVTPATKWEGWRPPKDHRESGAKRFGEKIMEKVLGGKNINLLNEFEMFATITNPKLKKEAVHYTKNLYKNAKAISDWHDTDEGKMFSKLKPVDVSGEINFLVSQGANNAAGALQDVADSIKKAGGILIEGTHNIGGDKEYFAVINGKVQLIDPFNAIIKADNKFYNIGQSNQAQSRIDE